VTSITTNIPHSLQHLRFCSFDCHSSLKEIQSGSFSHSPLTSLHIPSTVTIIHNSAFASCRSLSHISFAFPSSVTSFGASAFSRSVLQYFDLPISVQSISHFCFLDCECLSEFNVPESSSLQSIGTLVFRHSQINHFMIPSNVEKIAGAAFSRCGLKSVSIASNNSSFILKNDFLIHKDSFCLIEWFGESSALILPPDIRRIASSAFDGMELRDLTLNEGLLEIDHDAFAGLNLDVLVLSGTCEVDGFHFAKCAVRSVVTPNHGMQIKRGNAVINREKNS
jgi:hypothetical protein